MTLIVGNDAVARLISPEDVIETMDAAYRAHAAHNAVCAPRFDFQSTENERGEAYQLGCTIGLGSGGYACIRIKSDMVFQSIVGGQKRKQKYCIEPGTYLGLLMVFDLHNGALRAIVHDGLIQRMRVGADSALGVRYMAREDASVLGILGAGGMARSHLDAIATVRPLKHVRVFSPTVASREAFVREAREHHSIDIEAVDTPEAVFDVADILAACTNAVGPVVPGSLLSEGMHVTCIGGTLDADADERVDIALRFGTADAPAEVPLLEVEDECLTYAVGGRKAGSGGTRRFHSIPESRRVMFRDLLLDRSRGRSSARQITFSERGNIHGIQFAALAGVLYERAREAGLGTALPDGLFLQDIRN